MSKNCMEFISWLKDNDWEITYKSEIELKLNDNILTRYKNISQSYIEFLKRIKQCIAPSQKAWFICMDEYNSSSDIAFKWNEFELLSLEAAGNDEKWKADIISWWDKHLPIAMSVNEEYSFYAIDLSENIGSIVRGFAPEFEEVEKIANNIEEFFEMIMTNVLELI